MSTYFWVNMAAISVPLLCSFHPALPFYKHWNAFLRGCLFTAVPFLIWDMIFTRIGVWGFNELHVMGHQVLHLPIEEILFFFCIPYACVFTYFCLNRWLGQVNFQTKPLFLGAATLLLLVGLLSFNRLYTTSTFLLTGLFLTFLCINPRPFHPSMLITYLVLLLPFFITNGILTGSWINEEVVKYNDSENLGIRMGTIPIEDAFYGMLLIFMNISLFEHFRRPKKVT